MSDQETEILHTLLTKGVFTVKRPYNLEQLNTHLRTINCIAKEWYDKKYLILVHNTQRKDKNDMVIMQSILKNQMNAAVRERLPFLIENGWIEDNDLSKKFLMQYKSFVLEYSDNYSECEVCKILVKGKNMHEYCENRRDEIMDQLRNENK